jgi:hypothetical protein
MRQQIRQILALIIFLLPVTSCVKNNTSKQFNPFYTASVNNNQKSVDACGTSDYVAQYLGDTAMFTAFGCGGQRVGFYIKGPVRDGVYILDNVNSAWYDESFGSYITDSTNKGTLTIRSGDFQISGGSIPFIEGEFSFEAIDKNTGQKIKVTGGKYLLKKYKY